jgi:hypothetical protein
MATTSSWPLTFDFPGGGDQGCHHDNRARPLAVVAAIEGETEAMEPPAGLIGQT